MPSKMRVLISHSFGAASEDLFAAGFRQCLERRGIEVASRDVLAKKIIYHEVWKEDILDLWKSFRRAGLNPSWQEHADPNLPQLLVELIASFDVIVCLWSKDCANKLWTRFEWKTALAFGKPIVMISLDNHPLAFEFDAALKSNCLSVIHLNSGYRVESIVSAIERSLQQNLAAGPQFVGEVVDPQTGLRFIQLRHPIIGDFRISKEVLSRQMLSSILTSAKVDQICGSGGDSTKPLAVNWATATLICSLVSARVPYCRLPTETEWEFAARSGDASISGIPHSLETVIRQKAEPVVHNCWGIEFQVRDRIYEWCADEVRLYEYNGWVNPVQPEFIDGEFAPARAVRSYDRFGLDVWSISAPIHMAATQPRGCIRLVLREMPDQVRSVELSLGVMSSNTISPNAMHSNIRGLLSLSADAEHYHATLTKLADSGDLTSDLRQYLDECINGTRPTSFHKGMLQGLLLDIKDTTFLPPLMPAYLRAFYDSVVLRIEHILRASDQQVSADARLAKAKDEIFTLHDNGLLTRAFMELLRHSLRTKVAPDRGECIAFEVWKAGVELLADPGLIEGDYNWN